MARKYRRFIELAIYDSIVVVLTLWIGVYFLENYNVFNYSGIFWVLLFNIGITILIFTLLSLYTLVLEHVGYNEVAKVIIGVLLAEFIVYAALRLTTFDSFPLELIMFIAPMEILLMTGVRFSKRIIKSLFDLDPTRKFKYIRTLIIGAGSAGKLAYDEIQRNASLNNLVLGFIDDSKEKIGTRLNGIKVYGPIDDIHKYIEKLDIKEVIIAIAALSKPRLSDLVEYVSKSPVKIKRLPLTIEDDFNTTRQIVDVKIEDLLDRGVVNLDNDGLVDFLNNKIVLVTGGGGSIGSELCDQVLNYNPSKLIIFDIYENTTYDVQRALLKKIKNNRLNTELYVLIGSVYNKERLESIFRQYKPNIVFHAAAYKHVPLMK